MAAFFNVQVSTLEAEHFVIAADNTQGHTKLYRLMSVRNNDSIHFLTELELSSSDCAAGHEFCGDRYNQDCSRLANVKRLLDNIRRLQNIHTEIVSQYSVEDYDMNKIQELSQRIFSRISDFKLSINKDASQILGDKHAHLVQALPIPDIRSIVDELTRKYDDYVLAQSMPFLQGVPVDERSSPSFQFLIATQNDLDRLQNILSLKILFPLKILCNFLGFSNSRPEPVPIAD